MKILHATPNIKLIILFWIILLLFSLVFAIYFLKKPYRQWSFSRNQMSELNHQSQQRHSLFNKFQAIRNDSLSLENRYHFKLQFLQKPISLASLLSILAFLAQQQQIQITQMKPLQKASVENLQRQKIQIDMLGKEQQIINFLRASTKQNWLCDFQSLQLSTAAAGIRLQAILDIYYAPY